jgi:hypothetical protein
MTNLPEFIFDSVNGPIISLHDSNGKRRVLTVNENGRLHIKDPEFNETRDVMEVDSQYNVFLRDHWFGSDYSGILGWQRSIAGNSATAEKIEGEVGAPGIIRLSAGKSSTGRCALSLGTKDVVLDTAEITYEFKIRLHQASTNGLDYRVSVGFGDVTGNGEFANGVWFEHSAINRGYWIARTAKNNIRTTIVTTDPVSPGNWHVLKMIITDAAVQYFCGHTLLCTIDRNIPTGQAFSPIIKIEGISGAADRYFDLDFISINLEWPTNE